MQARSGVSGAGCGGGRWSGRVPRAAVLQGVGGLAAIRGGWALPLPVLGALLLAGERSSRGGV